MRRKRNLLTGLKPPSVTLPKPKTADLDPFTSVESFDATDAERPRPRPIGIPRTTDRGTITITSIPCRYTVGGRLREPDDNGNPMRPRDCSNPGCIERNACVRELSASGARTNVIRRSPSLADSFAAAASALAGFGAASNNIVTQSDLTSPRRNCPLCMDVGLVAHVPGRADYCPAVGCDARNHVRIEYTTNNTQRIARAPNINVIETRSENWDGDDEEPDEYE